MKLDSSWILIFSLGLVVLLFYFHGNEKFFMTGLITIILIGIFLEIIIPILSRDKNVIYTISFILLAFFFYVCLTLFKPELDSLITSKLGITENKWIEVSYWCLSAVLAFGGIMFEEFLVEKRNVSRKSIILGVVVFGALVAGLYEFFGEDALHNTIYGELANRIKEASKSFIAFLALLGSIYIKIEKENQQKKQTQNIR